ncbi:MAG TPA: hypothetical protein VNO55_09675, partial [Polyangia bacterium]|nr:hypothetical protein [Polyangia bacterium]
MQWIVLLASLGTLLADGCASGSAPAAGGGAGGGDAGTSAGSGGAGGANGSGGSGGVASVDASIPGDALETAAPPSDAARRDKVLIYGVTSPGAYRHASIPAAASAIARAAAAAGLTTEMVGVSDATNVVDRTKFTAAALAEYGAVVLL